MPQGKLYIILMQTGTLMSRLVHFMSKEPYSHVSIAFDNSFSVAYSFGRKNMDRILPAGFIEEDLPKVSARYPHTQCAVYTLTVGQQELGIVKDAVTRFHAQGHHSYNLLGALAAWANIPLERKRHLFCSQFVATVLRDSGIHLFDKSPELVSPRDFRLSPLLNPIYTGSLSALVEPSASQALRPERKQRHMTIAETL